MKLISTKAVLFRIAFVIMSIELIIMGVLAIIPPLPIAVQIVIDPLVLVLFSTPTIYYWIVKPFVDERNSAISESEYLAHTDALTQLPNRRQIIQYLDKVISESVRHKDHCAVLLLDLDGLKKVNDLYGHKAGDAILMTVAKRLASLTRTEDIVGRLGGDEFVMLVTRLGISDRVSCDKIQKIGEKIVALIQSSVVYQGHTLKVGTSIGARIISAEGISGDQALQDADIAMYTSKKTGGNKVVIFEPQMVSE